MQVTPWTQNEPDSREVTSYECEVSINPYCNKETVLLEHGGTSCIPFLTIQVTRDSSNKWTPVVRAYTNVARFSPVVASAPAFSEAEEAKLKGIELAKSVIMSQ